MKKYEEREPVVLLNHGQKIFATYHKPIGKAKFPAILFCHGLAGHRTGRYRIYVTLATHLVEKGFGVLRLDYRGAGDSEGEFVDSTVQGTVSDVLKGFEFLQQDSHVDQSRIGLFGRSYGGAVAIMATQKFHNVKTIALWAPMFDAEDWKEKWKAIQKLAKTNEQKDEMLRINGQRMGDAFLHEFFQINLVPYLKVLQSKPMLLIHGEKDEIVDFSHADRYLKQREHSLGLTKFLQLPQADHDFTGPRDQVTAIQETVSWFESTL